MSIGNQYPSAERCVETWIAKCAEAFPNGKYLEGNGPSPSIADVKQLNSRLQNVLNVVQLWDKDSNVALPPKGGPLFLIMCDAVKEEIELVNLRL